jgi:hypothetical protein
MTKHKIESERTRKLIHLKKRANILWREWSPRLGDELNRYYGLLGDTLPERIKSAQRVLDLTAAFKEVLEEMVPEIEAGFGDMVQAMKRSQAAVKANQNRKPRAPSSKPQA